MSATAIFQLQQTCAACPQAYNVYHDGEYVGSMRLRHGCFTVRYNNSTIYHAYPKGDGLFESDEKDKFLTEGCNALLQAIKAKEQNLYEFITPTGEF